MSAPTKSEWLEGLCWFSLSLCAIGFVSAFTPMKSSVGVLLPIGVTLFWVAGIIARRSPPKPPVSPSQPISSPSEKTPDDASLPSSGGQSTVQP